MLKVKKYALLHASLQAKARLVPNDNQASEHAPAFRIYSGHSELAWCQRSIGEKPRKYLSARLDDPSLPEPVSAAMFEAADGQEAQLVWSRRKIECQYSAFAPMSLLRGTAAISPNVRIIGQ